MDHTKMIESSLSQLMDLAAERDRIEHKMGKLHLAVRGLLNLVDDKAQREGFKAMLDNFKVRIGLTDLIRLCLTMSEKPMTPVEIRNFIINFGSDASTQQNLLQSVHTIVKRMAGDLVKEDVNEDGEKAYRLMSVGERMMRIGIEPKDAKKVGDQIENKFDSNKAWSEAFKDVDWLNHTLGVLGADRGSTLEILTDEEQLPERWQSRYKRQTNLTSSGTARTRGLRGRLADIKPSDKK